MSIIVVEACGFNNGAAILTYSYDDSFTPPEVVEVRLKNDGEADTFNVDILNRNTGAVVRSFSRAAKQGADLVLNRAQIVAQFGDVRMVDSVGHDGSHGWALPFNYRCFSS
jgi:hypothetical protein